MITMKELCTSNFFITIRLGIRAPKMGNFEFSSSFLDREMFPKNPKDACFWCVFNWFYHISEIANSRRFWAYSVEEAFFQNG